MIFHCRALTFSNSYLESKQDIAMLMLVILCLIDSLHQWVDHIITTVEKALCSTYVVLDPRLRLAVLTLSVAV